MTSRRVRKSPPPWPATCRPGRDARPRSARGWSTSRFPWRRARRSAVRCASPTRRPSSITGSVASGSSLAGISALSLGTHRRRRCSCHAGWRGRCSVYAYGAVAAGHGDLAARVHPSTTVRRSYGKWPTRSTPWWPASVTCSRRSGASSATRRISPAYTDHGDPASTRQPRVPAGGGPRARPVRSRPRARRGGTADARSRRPARGGPSGERRPPNRSWWRHCSPIGPRCGGPSPRNKA